MLMAWRFWVFFDTLNMLAVLVPVRFWVEDTLAVEVPKLMLALSEHPRWIWVGDSGELRLFALSSWSAFRELDAGVSGVTRHSSDLTFWVSNLHSWSSSIFVVRIHRSSSTFKKRSCQCQAWSLHWEVSQWRWFICRRMSIHHGQPTRNYRLKTK